MYNNRHTSHQPILNTLKRSTRRCDPWKRLCSSEWW